MKFDRRRADGRRHGLIRLTFEPEATHLVGTIAGMLGRELDNAIDFRQDYAEAVELMRKFGEYLTHKDVETKLRNNFSLYGYGDNDGEWVRYWTGGQLRRIRVLWNCARLVVDRLYPELAEDARAFAEIYVPNCSVDTCHRAGVDCDQHE